MSSRKLFLHGFVICQLGLGSIAIAEEVPEKCREIQDNSFLIEEAYNQEDGVIQHIQTFQYMKDDTWAYSFTQEWPVPNQKHQLSYTIPVEKIEDEGTQTGIGDVALNYRYQAVLREEVAVAPRFSLLLPTGDRKEGLGTGAVGFQVNLPVSVRLSEKLVSHYNLGLTFTPDAEDSKGFKSDTLGTNYGASLIYLASRNLNLMLEVAGRTEEAIVRDGKTEDENSLFINPGFRYAFDCNNGLQVVPGFSVPIGIGPSEGEYGVFAYLSFEHPLF